MKDTVKAEMENLRDLLKIHGPRTVHSLLSALLIWLFGNLVFIPIASTLNWQTEVLCTLIFFAAFTILVLRALPGLRKLVEAFSVPLARKCSQRRGLSYESSLVLSQNTLHIVTIVILYLLYFPFLASFHPAINGIVLILVLFWIFFLASRILYTLLPKIIEWFYS